MTVAKGMKINVFASEEMFPEFINPVQVAVDTDSRLWGVGVAVLSALEPVEASRR